MKPYLFSAIAITLLTAQPACAQSTNAKNSDNLLKDAHRITDEKPAVAHIEPAAGQNTSPSGYFKGTYAGGEIGHSFTDDVDGMSGGLFVGYGLEHEFGMFDAYTGIEFAYEWSGADGDAAGLSYNKNDAWLVTFRPGANVTDNALGYGIVGYTHAEFEGAGDKDNVDGLVLGLGGQFDTGTSFKPRLEYTYTNYEDSTLAGNSFDAGENAVKLGAVFQF